MKRVEKNPNDFTKITKNCILHIVCHESGYIWEDRFYALRRMGIKNVETKEDENLSAEELAELKKLEETE